MPEGARRLDPAVQIPLEIYLALAPDELVATLIGIATVQLAIRSGDETATPADAIRILLDGGAFDVVGEDWATTRARAIRQTKNYRRLYVAVGLVAQERRPQG